MTDNVVVLGAGYAGAGAIKSLEDELDGEADVTWISDTDYHLVLHESHRCIRDPSVQDKVTIPVHEIKEPSTAFVQDEVVGVDVDEQVVELEDSDAVEYDYLLVALGSQTAFFGIDGLEEYAHTLKSLDDALGIHDDVQQAAREASQNDPAQIVVGGAGLSGIQTAGEIAEFRDEHRAPIDQTENERVFAIGDCALIDQPGDQPAPPTAQAAWQAAEVAGENLARAVRNQPLKTWTHKDKGTVVSVGEKAVAHDVMGSPIATFGGFPAQTLKKVIATRWINDITGVGRAARAWPDM